MSELCRYLDIAYAPDLGCTLTVEESLNPEDPKLAPMSTEEHIAQLTAQVTALQAQLAHHSQSPPPPQPSAAPVPTPNPPNVPTPSPFSGTQADLDPSKPKASLSPTISHSTFLD